MRLLLPLCSLQRGSQVLVQDEELLQQDVQEHRQEVPQSLLQEAAQGGDQVAERKIKAGGKSKTGVADEKLKDYLMRTQSLFNQKPKYSERDELLRHDTHLLKTKRS